MLYFNLLIQLLVIGVSSRTFFDAKMARTPARMIVVGFFLCGAGICLGATVASFEGMRIFSHEHGALEVVSQLINVSITAAGGNVLSSGLVLRAEIANQRSIADAKRRLQVARATISQLRKEHKLLAIQESLLPPADFEKCSLALLRAMQSAEDNYQRANEMLDLMGLAEDAEPYPPRSSNSSGRRI